MNIVEMREKRAKLWATMEGFLDTHRNDKGVLSAEDDNTYTNMETEFESLSNEIRRQERRDAHEVELNKAVNKPLTEKPAVSKESGVGRASANYKEDFGLHLRGKQPVHNVLATTPDADGGFLVPTEFEDQIVTALDDENVIRRLAKVITTHHDSKIPVALVHSVAQWTTENSAYTESNPTFAQKQIDAFKLTDLCRVSIELLKDSAFDIEAYLRGEFARAFGVAEEQAFCVGNGTDQPTGIFTANGGTVGVTTASATAITVDEVISLVHALKAPYRKNAKFLMNDATVAMLRKLKDQYGQYLWQPSVQAGTPDRLLGYEIYTSPYVPVAASGALAIAFGDFNNYWIGDRAGRTVQRLNELYAANGQIGYVATERVDGKVILPEGIQLLKMKTA